MPQVWTHCALSSIGLLDFDSNDSYLPPPSCYNKNIYIILNVQSFPLKKNRQLCVTKILVVLTILKEILVVAATAATAAAVQFLSNLFFFIFVYQRKIISEWTMNCFFLFGKKREKRIYNYCHLHFNYFSNFSSCFFTWKVKTREPINLDRSKTKRRVLRDEDLYRYFNGRQKSVGCLDVDLNSVKM